MALLEFLLTLLVFYYVGKLLWGAVLAGAAHRQREFMQGRNDPTPDADKKETISIGQMVECARCGTFVAKEQALIKNGKTYCSSKCMNL